MPATIRVRKNAAPEIQIILTRAPGEDNLAPPADLAIKGHDTRVARRNPVTHNEWMVIMTASIPASAIIVQAIVSWVNGRNGRRYRIKHGDREYEAPSPKEMKKLIKLAGEELDIRIISPTEKRK